MPQNLLSKRVVVSNTNLLQTNPLPTTIITSSAGLRYDQSSDQRAVEKSVAEEVSLKHYMYTST